MYKTVYTGHLKGKRVLLETPTGFAVFVVKDFAFKQDKNIWVHFSDPECAIQALSALGFKKVDNKSAARNGEAGPGNDLKQLIEEFCSDAETLIVEDEKLKASIEKMTRIRCRCDGYDVDEVIWGIKNVLHAFIREEERNITQEYCLPMSKGLREALQYYVVNIPPEKIDKTFITKFGFLCYLDMNLEDFPKELSRSFDEYVGIGDTIKDGLDYVKVLAMVLLPELVEEFGFSETFPEDLKSKLHRAKLFQASREDVLTMHDVEKIMGYLDYLLHVPQLRDKIIMDVKLMEMTLIRSLTPLQRVDVCGREPVDLNKVKFKKVLLETPSGFATPSDPYYLSLKWMYLALKHS
uniref:Uncharacterized protein n=1 Tax=Avena sativa TaxID=4498 RepID=A0ACD5YP80_AVESA